MCELIILKPKPEKLNKTKYEIKPTQTYGKKKNGRVHVETQDIRLGLTSLIV